MIPRLVTVIIFLFCGTMTALLVKSVLHPEASGLADVSPNVLFDLFAARTEGSELDVWETNRITGNCYLSPQNIVALPHVRREQVKVNIKFLIKLRQEIMGSSVLDLSGSAMLHSSGSVDHLSLDLQLAGSVPPLKLSIRQAGDSEWPSLTLSRGKEVLFESLGGKSADAANSWLVSAMLNNIGLPEDIMTGKQAREQASVTVRAGHIEAGGETFDGYLLASGGAAESQFRLYMANTGEILRIDTPLTGDNGLGLRFLARSLRPPDAKSPVLEAFPQLKSPP